MRVNDTLETTFSIQTYQQNIPPAGAPRWGDIRWSWLAWLRQPLCRSAKILTGDAGIIKQHCLQHRRLLPEAAGSVVSVQTDMIQLQAVS